MRREALCSMEILSSTRRAYLALAEVLYDYIHIICILYIYTYIYIDAVREFISLITSVGNFGTPLNIHEHEVKPGN